MPELVSQKRLAQKAVKARERNIEPFQAGRTVQATNPQVDCLLTMESFFLRWSPSKRRHRQRLGQAGSTGRSGMRPDQ
jgi:hypothetical protein